MDSIWETALDRAEREQCGSPPFEVGETATVVHDFTGGEFDADCRCSQKTCLPAQQLNHEVEIHTARETAVAEWRERRREGDEAALRDYYRAFSKVLDTLFGGDR